jgi:hypothetical protein
LAFHFLTLQAHTIIRPKIGVKFSKNLAASIYMFQD